MKACILYGLPPEAIAIRQTVFVEEQGFRDEFDEVDNRAAHVLLYDGDTAAAVCRVYEDQRGWMVGRFAVLKQYRMRHLGSLLMNAARSYVKEQGGNVLYVHAQCQAAPFYKKQGFIPFGEQDYEENCPHIWMKKEL